MQRISVPGLIISVFLFSIAVNSSMAQGSGDSRTGQVEDILNHALKAYRLDDRLVNGTYYVPKHPLALEHPYFLTKEWQDATLYIKGIRYNNVHIKYNIEDDLVVLKRQHELGLVEQILLNNSYIDSITIGDHHFINSAVSGIEDPIGYLERIYMGRYVSFLKHERLHKDELTHQVRYGRYMDPKSTLCIYYDDQLVRIHDKKAFLEIFHKNEKEVKKFMRKNKIRFRKATKDQFVNLLKYCDEL